MKIIYVPKEALFPSFGMSYNDGHIEIREDLPERIKQFLVYHETYHTTDKAKNWIWREIKANTYGAIKCPLGFLITLVYSLQPYRIWYYIQRIKDKK